MRSAALGLIAGAILTPPPAGADDALDRFRPTLVYDRDERDRTTAVDAIAPRLGDRDSVDLEGERPGREVVHGHRARDSRGRTWLQYWLFFLTNTQDRGVVRTGRHEGDWELVQLRLDHRGRPDLATLSQHSWAEGCPPAELRSDHGAPVIHVANGSHALLSHPGVGDRQWPDPDDEADGRGRRVRPPVVELADGRPGWTRWPGRWGDSDAGIVPGEQSSPRGPAFAEGGAWRDPAAFHDDRARGCGADPPRRAWQWPLLAALVALALLLPLRRATYNRRRDRA
jgi:hypothetical protein